MRPNVYEIQVMDYFNSGNIFTGSRNGMRYKVEPFQPEDAEKTFLVTIWPEPLCFEKTPDYQKVTKQFPFNEEGRQELLAYLEENYQAETWKELAHREPPQEPTAETPDTEKTELEEEVPF